MSDEVKLETVYTLLYSYYVLPFDYKELIIAKSACSKKARIYCWIVRRHCVMNSMKNLIREVLPEITAMHSTNHTPLTFKPVSIVCNHTSFVAQE